MSLRSFFASFKPSVAAEMAKQRTVRRAAIANPHANRPGDPTESTFLGAITTGAKKVASAIAPHPKAHKDFRPGYRDPNAAPESRAEWSRPPGFPYPATPPVISQATKEEVKGSQPVSAAQEAQAQMRARAELSQIAAVPVPGLSTVLGVGQLVAGALGYDPVYHWDLNVDPYDWQNTHPALPRDLSKTVLLGNLRQWQAQAQAGQRAPLTAKQQYFVDHDGAPMPDAALTAPVSDFAASVIALAAHAPTPVVVSVADTPKGTVQLANPYNLSDDQVAVIRRASTNPLTGPIFRSKYPLLFE
jgi:hypothetical protein